ncbi:MAG: hypothetical protein NZL95_04635 [Chitinophagales bacterium]|nr:hypothetical protein [Chitinophagales bacterium]MDW8427819.1 hypothetical protein [Chitinophagales bacterium]
MLVPAPATALVHEIAVKNFEFIQPFDTVRVGDTIRWKWLEGNHTTTSNGIPAGAQPWNELLTQRHPEFTYVITVAGLYQYLSIPYAPVMGSSFIAIDASGLADPPVIVGCFCAQQTLTLQLAHAPAPGTTLRLFNPAGQLVTTPTHLMSATFRLALPDLKKGIWIVETSTANLRTSRKVSCL